jgi:hypothetical protein
VLALVERERDRGKLALVKLSVLSNPTGLELMNRGSNTFSKVGQRRTNFG